MTACIASLGMPAVIEAHRQQAELQRQELARLQGEIERLKFRGWVIGFAEAAKHLETLAPMCAIQNFRLAADILRTRVGRGVGATDVPEYVAQEAPPT